MRRILLSVLAVCYLTASISSLAYAQPPSGVYTVKSGDSLWQIAELYHTDVDEIIDQNQLQHPTIIYAGQKLLINQVQPEVKQAEKKVLELTNQARAAHGLSPLSSNWYLTRIARAKSEDMRDHSYLAHHSPTYGSPFEMMRSYQIAFRSAEENVSAGQTSAEEAVKSWLSSPDNKRNILNPSLSEIGCGVAFGGNMGAYWTQEFILK